MGGNEAFIVLGLAAGIGLVTVVEGRRIRQGRWVREAVALAVLGVISVVTLAAGWRGSVWNYRYLAVVIGPLFVLVALGLARSGRVGLAALGVTAVLTAPLAVRGPSYQKSNLEALSAEVSPSLRRGDLVVAPDFQLVPLAAHYLPPGLRYATASRLVPDEDSIDWRQSTEGLINDDPTVTLAPLMDGLPPGARVLLLCRPPAPNEVVTAATAGRSFHALLVLRCRQSEDVVARRDELEVIQRVNPPDGVLNTSVRAEILVKKSPAGLAG